MNTDISDSKNIQKSILILGDVFFVNNDIKRFIDLIKNELKDYVVLANLEGSINLVNNNSKKSVPLSLPKFNPNDLPSNLYFSVVNNHTTDFGIDNFFKNIGYLKNKVVYSSKEEVEVYINSKKFIFLADKKEQCILKGTNFLSFSNRVVKNISNNLKNSHVIVHGGIEYRKHPTHYQRSLARKIIDSGAESVTFHHSHIVGEYEYWEGKLIHYGLGNAFFSDTLNLHKLEKSISHGIIIDTQVRILNLNILDPIGVVNSSDKNNSHDNKYTDYKKFYKNKYKIDSSFRPRQLFVNDLFIEIQYYLWSLVANFIVKNKLSKPIKTFLNKYIKTNNE